MNEKYVESICTHKFNFLSTISQVVANTASFQEEQHTHFNTALYWRQKCKKLFYQSSWFFDNTNIDLSSSCGENLKMVHTS